MLGIFYPRVGRNEQYSEYYVPFFPHVNLHQHLEFQTLTMHQKIKSPMATLSMYLRLTKVGCLVTDLLYQ